MSSDVRTLSLAMTMRLRIVSIALSLATVGCGGGRSAVEETATPVRLAPPEPVVTCPEWVERAVADPEIAVERVPSVVKFDPPPIPRALPKGVIGKDGKAEIRVTVVVDTLGVPDMRTFKVVKSSHPTLTRSVRTAVAKWKFVPAEVGGCKVPRNFNGVWVAGGSAGGK